MKKKMDITTIMKSSYYEYAKAVYTRAIPSIDGFTEASRRLLYMAYSKGYYKYVKCAKLSGDTMGSLHPHGSAYSTIITLSTKYHGINLMDFHGNIGQYGGVYKLQDDPPAAERYTECKLSDNHGFVFQDWIPSCADLPSYDGQMMEPTLLPVSIPIILARRHTGIGVGFASSIQPFSLADISKMLVLWDEKQTKEEYANLLIKEKIFPTIPSGGEYLIDKEKLFQAYSTGRGSFRIRAIYKIQDRKVTITELPPDVSPSSLCEEIAKLHKATKGSKSRISKVENLTRETPHVEVHFKRNTSIKQIKDFLNSLKSIEKTVSINHTILKDGIPHQYSLWELIKDWIAFRKLTLSNKQQYLINRLNEKINRKELLIKVASHIVEVAKILDKPAPENKLKKLLEIEDEDLKVILSFSLSQLRKIEIEVIKKELKSLTTELKKTKVWNINTMAQNIGEYSPVEKKKISSSSSPTSAPSKPNWKKVWRDYVRTNLGKLPREYSTYLKGYTKEPPDIKPFTDKFIKSYGKS